MSVENVKEQIERFLKSSKPEVLCIRGHWGTGKTYVWQTAAKENRGDKTKVALDQYAYVSLFGVNSINQLRSQILQNTIPRAEIGNLVTNDTIKKRLNGIESSIKRGIMSVLNLAGDGVFDAVVSGLSLMVSKQIICLDDLERKGADLRAGDVLGYVSYLKEERECKVVILLNQDALEGEDADQFRAYLEKVIDINLSFAPKPAQSAEIAMEGIEGSDDLKAIVSERCIQLGIDNIRVIRKIMRSTNEIAPALEGYRNGVLKSVVSSLVLLGWSHHQPELGPPLDYLRSLGQYFPSSDIPDLRRETLKERWGETLRSYGYHHTDQLDEILIKGTVDGFFGAGVLTSHANLLELRERTKEAEIELDVVWQLFHRTLNNNVEELAAEFVSCAEKNIGYYTFNTAMQIVDLLRRIERPDESQKVFDLFAASREGNPDAFDLDRLARFGQELPADILEAVMAIKAQSVPELTVDQLFLSLKQDGFNSVTATRLAALPVEEYVRVLKSHEGDDLMRIRAGLTDYVEVGNPSPTAVTIMNSAADALTLIAGDDPLGKARINSWRLVQWQTSWAAHQAAQQPPE